MPIKASRIKIIKRAFLFFKKTIIGLFLNRQYLFINNELRDGVGREEGGGFRMGSVCIPVADSF